MVHKLRNFGEQIGASKFLMCLRNFATTTKNYFYAPITVQLCIHTCGLRQKPLHTRLIPVINVGGWVWGGAVSDLSGATEYKNKQHGSRGKALDPGAAGVGHTFRRLQPKPDQPDQTGPLFSYSLTASPCSYQFVFL